MYPLTSLQAPRAVRAKQQSSSAVIDEFLKQSELQHEKLGIAYFYCDFRDPGRHSLSEVFGSLTAQLSQQNSAFRAAVWKYYDSKQWASKDVRVFEPEALVDIMIQHCTQFDQITLVLDAIDECPDLKPDQIRTKLLKCLLHVHEKTNGKVRIVITSRAAADIQHALRKVPSLSVVSDWNSKDIELYVKTELEQTVLEDDGWLGDEESTRSLSLSIMSRIVSRANGM